MKMVTMRLVLKAPAKEHRPSECYEVVRTEHHDDGSLGLVLEVCSEATFDEWWSRFAIDVEVLDDDPTKGQIRLISQLTLVSP